MAIAQLSQFNFHHTLEDTEGTSLVYFTGLGCGACRQLKRVFEEHEQAFQSIHLFEVDAQQEMALTREFEVFHLPSMFLFHNGHYHAPIHAEPRAHSLLAAIDEALSAAPQEAP